MDPRIDEIQVYDGTPPPRAEFEGSWPDEASSEAGPPPAPRPSRGRTLVRELVQTGLLSVLVFLCVRASFGTYKVEGHSMDPTLADGQFLIVNKLSYSRIDVQKLRRLAPFWGEDGPDERDLFSGPGRGDIIILHDPRNPDGKELVKRVVGLPGETIEIAAGRVYINGRLLDEPYIKQQWSDEKPKILIPPGEYYVLGDNRGGRADSRYFGLVPRELIVGKVALRTWPPGDAGTDFGGKPTLATEATRP